MKSGFLTMEGPMRKAKKSVSKMRLEQFML
jgi:hypothetical protein